MGTKTFCKHNGHPDTCPACKASSVSDSPEVDRQKYINDLGECYNIGISEEDLPAEELFKALVNDLLEKVVDGETSRS